MLDDILLKYFNVLFNGEGFFFKSQKPQVKAKTLISKDKRTLKTVYHLGATADP